MPVDNSMWKMERVLPLFALYLCTCTYVRMLPELCAIFLGSEHYCFAAQDPDHSGELYPIIITIPAEHDYYMFCRGLECGAAFAWPRLRCLNM